MAKKSALWVRPALYGGYLVMNGSHVIAQRTTEIEARALLDSLVLGREIKLK